MITEKIRANFNIRKNDMVMVMSGRNRGKSGRVLKVDPAKNTAIIEKVNFIKKHQRPNAQLKQGGIVEKEGPLRLDILSLVCPKCTKAVKVRIERVESGERQRLCKKCGDLIEQKK